jgi:hypothetical protein
MQLIGNGRCPFGALEDCDSVNPYLLLAHKVAVLKVAFMCV